MSAPDYPYDPQAPGGMDETVRKDAADLAKTAKSDLGGLTEEVKQQAAALGEEAKSQLGDVAQKAKGMAAEQKDLVAGQLTGISEALGKVAGELENNGDSTAHYVRMVADSADKLTGSIRDNDVDSLLAMAQDFGRRQPVAFMGAAAVLGFAASRFVLASASRSRSAGDTSAASGGTYAGTARAPDTDYASPTQTPGYARPTGGDDVGV